jgi:outer membrane protein assembly factor BamA
LYFFGVEFPFMKTHLLASVLVLLILCILDDSTRAQTAQPLWLQLDAQAEFIKQEVDSSLGNVKHLHSLQIENQAEGYLLWTVDSTLATDSALLAWITPGPLFAWNNIRINSSQTTKLKRSGRKLYKSTSWTTVRTEIDATLTEFENHGYPFAQVRFEDLHTDSAEISVSLELVPGPLVLIDSLIVKSDDKVNSRYLQAHLGIRKNDLYNESQILSISKRIQEIAFLSELRPTEVQFTEEGAWINVYVKRKKANAFNGVIGIQQNDNDDKITITGDIDLKLQNVINQGESIQLNWKRIQAASQQLEINLSYPYLLRTALGIDGSLDIFKRDSTFSSANLSGGLIYRFAANKLIKAFVRQESSSTSLTGTQLNLASSKALSYGLAGQFESVDYRFNPSRGVVVSLEGAAGTKSIDRPSLDESSETIKLNQYSFAGGTDLYIPIFGRFVGKIGSKGATKLSDEVYENEMFRFGGMKTMRGMDESSHQVSSFAVGSVEIRYLLEQNSFVHLFFDQGWWESKTPTKFVTDTPIGFGAGISFETKSGIFALTYAMGKQFGNPILIRNAKIHFGFTSFF